MIGHGKMVCSRCGKVIHDCHCTSPEASKVKHVVCSACEAKGKAWVCQNCSNDGKPCLLCGGGATNKETKMAIESEAPAVEIKPGDMVCLKGTTVPKMVVGAILGLKAECWWSEAASFYANGGPMVTTLKSQDLPVAALVKA